MRLPNRIAKASLLLVPSENLARGRAELHSRKGKRPLRRRISLKGIPPRSKDWGWIALAIAKTANLRDLSRPLGLADSATPQAMAKAWSR
jgi:hypothetical protein